MEHSIITECLCKSFGEKQVLNSISLKVKKGEIFGLLGPSGAGKTTFLNILTGQIQADSGKGLIFGQNIREFTAQMYTRIGMLLDNCGLYARLSGYQNLKIMSIIYGLSDDEITIGVKEENGKWKLETNVYDYLPQNACAVISTETLGMAFEPEQKYENPDGTPIVFRYDYFGNRQGIHPLPGPFASKEAAEEALS